VRCPRCAITTARSRNGVRRTRRAGTRRQGESRRHVRREQSKGRASCGESRKGRRGGDAPREWTSGGIDLIRKAAPVEELAGEPEKISEAARISFDESRVGARPKFRRIDAGARSKSAVRAGNLSGCEEGGLSLLRRRIPFARRDDSTVRDHRRTLDTPRGRRPPVELLEDGEGVARARVLLREETWLHPLSVAQAQKHGSLPKPRARRGARTGATALPREASDVPGSYRSSLGDRGGPPPDPLAEVVQRTRRSSERRREGSARSPNRVRILPPGSLQVLSPPGPGPSVVAVALPGAGATAIPGRRTN